jgi:tetratricopeptide (TPR) repeat protein
LEGFRTRYPTHKLKQDITKKLAIVYKEDGQYQKAAREFERIEQENPDNEQLRREALDQAAELYTKANDNNRALQVYKKVVQYFPKPLEGVMEARHKIANIYRRQHTQVAYINELHKIVQTDANGGAGRTARTKYLAANAALYLAEPKLDEFKKIKLNQPFKPNLRNKKQRMQAAIAAYTQLVVYEGGDVTAAATYYIAEIYYEFNTALVASERPSNLSAADLEDYELMIEEQAYPFEEKAITIHKNNLELMENGIYNKWIDKSIKRLAKLLPARFGKTEEATVVIDTIKPKPIVKKTVEKKQIHKQAQNNKQTQKNSADKKDIQKIGQDVTQANLKEDKK